MLPVNTNQRLIGLLRVSDFLRDTVLLPEPLNLLKPLCAQMQRVSPSRKKTDVTLDAFRSLIYYSPAFPGSGKAPSYRS